MTKCTFAKLEQKVIVKFLYEDYRYYDEVPDMELNKACALAQDHLDKFLMKATAYDPISITGNVFAVRYILIDEYENF